MTIYKIEYDNMPLATVEIDHSKAEKPIQEMVEFWMSWHKNLEDNYGSYARSWLKNLALFILHNQRPPKDDEGWVPMDGSYGITLKSWDNWHPDDDLISIE